VVSKVGTIKVHDGADEFRIEIEGQFAGDCVKDAQAKWSSALLETAPRRVMVDISRLTGWDGPGHRTLSSMYRHGTQFAAGTPSALVFLGEIAAPAPSLRTSGAHA
jgi:hypothetical protein